MNYKCEKCGSVNYICREYIGGATEVSFKCNCGHTNIFHFSTPEEAWNFFDKARKDS